MFDTGGIVTQNDFSSEGRTQVNMSSTRLHNATVAIKSTLESGVALLGCTKSLRANLPIIVCFITLLANLNAQVCEGSDESLAYQ